MIPAELCERRQWVVWTYEKRDGKETKVPYVARPPQNRGASSGVRRKWRASSTDPSTWRTYEVAKAVAADGFDGIGFVFSKEDPYTGVDLDKCLDESGSPRAEAAGVVHELASYTERTPSGEGLHIIIRAKLTGSRKRTSTTPWGGEFEVYDRERYFTMTGESLNGAAIEDRQAALDSVYQTFFPPPSVPELPDPLPELDLDDEELLRRASAAKGGADFERLFGGDTSGYPSRSEARLALLNKLAFWSGPDPRRIDSLFRRSGLMCEKWDRLGESEIAKALEGRVEFYEPTGVVQWRTSGQDHAHPPDAPIALWLDEFLAEKTEMPPALIGDSEDVILPVAGFAILGGKGGRGKTTLMVDGALHLASGVDWLGFPVPRPLNVLLVENEGSREMFRRKLAAKREGWPHELNGRVAVYTLDWGGFDLRSEKTRSRLRAFVEENEVDLVFGDPLDSCGFEGVGSPEDTRDFMALARAVGLHRDVAFWFNHHPKKDKMEDELDSLSGAWGGRPDTVFTLNTLEGNRARLGIPKTRWGKTGKRSALILSFDPETESFELLKEETESRDYVEEITDLLRETPWLTVVEISAPADKGGIGAGRPKVKEALEAERFIQREGAEIGRSSKAHADVWGLA